MIAEAHIGAFGAIGVGGVAAFVIGSLMMFPSRAPGFALSYAVVIGTAICSAALFLVALAVLLRSRKRPVVTGSEALIGASGEAVFVAGRRGQGAGQRRNLAGARRCAARRRQPCQSSRSRRPRSSRPTALTNKEQNHVVFLADHLHCRFGADLSVVLHSHPARIRTRRRLHARPLYRNQGAWPVPPGAVHSADGARRSAGRSSTKCRRRT